MTFAQVFAIANASKNKESGSSNIPITENYLAASARGKNSPTFGQMEEEYANWLRINT